jgi:hypothetical protein
MSAQLEQERRLVGDASTKTLIKEMLTVPSNRKRALISVVLMICQRMTGVNAIVGPTFHPTAAGFISFPQPGLVLTSGCTTGLLRSSNLQEPRHDRHRYGPLRHGYLRYYQSRCLLYLPCLRCRLARSPHEFAMDLNGSGNRHVPHWYVRPCLASCSGPARKRLWLRRHYLYLPVGCVSKYQSPRQDRGGKADKGSQIFPVWLGTGRLDSCL